MLEKSASRALALVPRTISQTGCTCPGCQRHIARLEELNKQLAVEVDRLRRERGEVERAA
jgi:hypothetical protein